MNPCEECPIDDKIYECCGRFPDTGETANLTLDSSRTITACPYLDCSGRCTIYETRPLGCRSHYCLQYSSGQQVLSGYLDVIEIMATND